MAKPKRTKQPKIEDGNYIREQSNGKTKFYKADEYLLEKLKENTELFIAEMKPEERLKITRDYVTHPGSVLGFHMEFDGREVKGSISVLKAKKSLREQAEEIINAHHETRA